MPIPPVIEQALSNIAYNFNDFGYYLAVLSVFRVTPIPEDRRKDTDVVQVLLKSDDWVRLEYNPDKLDKYTVDNWQFLLCHEAGHLLFEHLRTQKDQPGDVREAWVLSCEAAINDRLMNTKFSYFAPTDEFITTSIVNQRFNLQIPPGLTDEEIYQAIRAQASQEQMDQIKEFVNSGTPLLVCGGAHSETDQDPRHQELMENLLDQVMHTANQLANVMEVDPTQAQKVWGTQALGSVRGFTDDTAYRIPWEELLAQALASQVKDEQTLGYNRKWAHIDPGRPPMIAMKEVPDPKVICYVDLSGSISMEIASRFREVMKRYPRADYYTFDTSVYEVIDWDNLRGGGGTDFQILVDHADEQHPQPDVCVVLTDGYANTPKVGRKDKWVWVVIPGGTTNNIKDSGRVIEILDD